MNLWPADTGGSSTRRRVSDAAWFLEIPQDKMTSWQLRVVTFHTCWLWRLLISPWSMVLDCRTRTDLELADFLQKAVGLALLRSASTWPWHVYEVFSKLCMLDALACLHPGCSVFHWSHWSSWSTWGGMVWPHDISWHHIDTCGAELCQAAAPFAERLAANATAEAFC